MYKRGYVLLHVAQGTSYTKALESIQNHDSQINKIEPKIPEEIFPYLPSGTIIIKDSSQKKDTGYITLPIFSSHLSLPVKEGEYVWFFIDDLSIDERNFKKLGESYPLLQIKNYWISRIHGYSIASEDPNYTNIERNMSLEEVSSHEENITSNVGITTEDKKAKSALIDESNSLSSLPDHEKDDSYQAVFNFEDNIKNGYELYKSKSQNAIDSVPKQTVGSEDFLIQGSNNTSIVFTKDLVKNKGEIDLICGKYTLKDYVESHDEVENDIELKIKSDYVLLDDNIVSNSLKQDQTIGNTTFLHKIFPHIKNIYGDQESLKVPYKYIKNDALKDLKQEESREFSLDASYITMYMNANLSTLHFSDFSDDVVRLDKHNPDLNINKIEPGKDHYSFLKTTRSDFEIVNSPKLEEKEEDIDKKREKYEDTVPSILIKSNDIHIVARKELQNVLEKDKFISDGCIKIVKDGYYRGENKNSYSHLIFERNGDVLLDGKTLHIGDFDREIERLMLSPEQMHGEGEGVVLGYDQNLSEPLVLGKTLQVILNEILETNIEALDYISKAFAEISKNFSKLDEDHTKLKAWASTHVHPSTATSPGAPAVLGPGAPIPIVPAPSANPLEVDLAKLKTDTDASSDNNGGQEIERLQGVIDNLYKMLSRFSKTT